MKIWFNLKEAADHIRTSTRSLRRYVNKTKDPIPCNYLGNQLRFHISDLDSWLTYKKPYDKLTRPQKEVIKERNSYGR